MASIPCPWTQKNVLVKVWHVCCDCQLPLLCPTCYGCCGGPVVWLMEEYVHISHVSACPDPRWQLYVPLSSAVSARSSWPVGREEGHGGTTSIQHKDVLPDPLSPGSYDLLYTIDKPAPLYHRKETISCQSRIICIGMSSSNHEIISTEKNFMKFHEIFHEISWNLKWLFYTL